jgi:hypothetical protein
VTVKCHSFGFFAEFYPNSSKNPLVTLFFPCIIEKINITTTQCRKEKLESAINYFALEFP